MVPVTAALMIVVPATDTRVGEIELQIPKLRTGSYLPSFLEPRRRPEQALIAVVQEAYVNGVSTRKVDRLVEQIGLRGLSKDQVSRMCRGLDEQVELFRGRPLDGAYPWLDAKIKKVREPGGVRQKALVIAYAVHETGVREVLGIDVGEAETEAFWTEFLFSLKTRGLSGVRLCVSDAHQRLRNAIARVLGCCWQRCTVHFPRDMLGHCGRSQQPMITTAIRQVFAADDGTHARERLDEVVDRLTAPAPKVAGLLEDAADDLLGFYAFPRDHWPKLRSTPAGAGQQRDRPPLRHRRDLPQRHALIRPAGMLLIEQNDEWLVQRRYLSDHSIQQVLTAQADPSDNVNTLKPQIVTDDQEELHHDSLLDYDLLHELRATARRQRAGRGVGGTGTDRPQPMAPAGPTGSCTDADRAGRSSSWESLRQTRPGSGVGH